MWGGGEGTYSVSLMQKYEENIMVGAFFIKTQLETFFKIQNSCFFIEVLFFGY